MVIAGSFSSLEEVLSAKLEESLVDVLLVSYDIHRANLASILRSLRIFLPAAHVLLIADTPSEAKTNEIVDHGSASFFPKQGCLSNLCAAIECVARGEFWLSPEKTHAPLQVLSEDIGKLRLGTIEKQVLQDIYDGLSNKEIGDRLLMSESNVKAYVQKLFRKTGVRVRSQLVKIAVQRSQELGVRL